MRRIGLVLWIGLLSGPVLAVDADYQAACVKVAAAKGEPAGFVPVCVCAYGVIEGELGADFTARYMRWETGAATLAEVLPEGMDEDGFFAALGGIDEGKWAVCGGDV